MAGDEFEDTGYQIIHPDAPAWANEADRRNRVHFSRIERRINERIAETRDKVVRVETRLDEHLDEAEPLMLQITQPTVGLIRRVDVLEGRTMALELAFQPITDDRKISDGAWKRIATWGGLIVAGLEGLIHWRAIADAIVNMVVKKPPTP